MRKVLLFAMVLACASTMFAQEAPQNQMLPTDPDTRIGQLPNGLTYYIRHNELPEHHAEFYIAQKVGSVLEEESQRGLAHFLEHMAFNGTKNFPGNSLRDYLERHGVKFGANLNAYTSIDETVYNISDVPIDETLHPNIIDSCLLILHDWSGCISLEGEEIDKERGVIHEEWRSRSSAISRMRDETAYPKVFGNNRYGHRMPIGLMEVVDNFKYEEIRNYYHTWYRPDLQGIFVVGDVDVDAVEAKIKAMWSDIETPTDAPARTEFKVDDFDQPIVVSTSDKEFSYDLTWIVQKYEKRPAEMSQTVNGYVLDIVEYIAENAVSERLEELMQKPSSPLRSAGIRFGNFFVAKNDGGFMLTIINKEGQRKEAMQEVVNAARTFLAHGVTEAEVERVKANILSSLETHYNERNKTKNSAYIREIQSHFIGKQEMMGIEKKYEVAKKMLPTINADLINAVLQQMYGNLLKDEKNLAIIFFTQEKEGVVNPTEEQILADYRECMKAEIQGFVENQVSTQLLEKEPKKLGKIKKVEEGPFGSTIWTLSNGATVLWKKTDYKDNQILFKANSYGGTDAAGLTKVGERAAIIDALIMGGLGNFSQTDLGKALAGKEVSLNRDINRTNESLSGNTTPKDLRTFMQLLYLGATQPRPDKELFDSRMKQAFDAFRNRENTPMSIINDSLDHFTYINRPDMWSIHSCDIEGLDFDKLFKLGAERFMNAADFRFYFIGNIDEDSLSLLCRTYIANLPSKGKTEPKGAQYLISRGTRTMRFEVPMKTPLTTNRCNYILFDQPWNLKDDISTSILGQMLRAQLTATIREEEGGTYSPQANASFNEETGVIAMVYLFDTDAEKVDRLDSISHTQIVKMSESVSEEEFLKVRDYMVKRHQELIKENSYWINNIKNLYEEKFNFVDGYDDVLNSITPADIQTLCKRILDGADRMRFVAVGVAEP